MVSRCRLLLLAALFVAAAHADPLPFDLAGPNLEVKVTRGANTLPISEVPNLARGDRLWIKADLPPTQSAHYLLVAAFLSGSTNPPPASWFFLCETWARPCAQEGLTVTVPQDAQQVLVFLAPWCESYLATTRPAISASCRRTREQVSELSGNQRVRWIGIASGLWASPDDLREYQTENKIRIPLTLDESGKLFRTFRVTDVPTVLIADSNGKVIQRVNSDDPDGLRKAIVGL